MEKKKILLVVTEFGSGMGYFAATVANALGRCEDFVVRSICVCRGSYTCRDMMEPQSHPVFVDYPQQKVVKLFYKFWPSKIIKVLKQEEDTFQPDVVHFLTGDFSMAYYIRWHKKENYYYTVHNLHPHETVFTSLLSWFMYHVIRIGYQMCLENINNLTTSSKSQYRELQQMFPNKKCVFTPAPTVVMDCEKKGTRVPDELKEEKDYILFFGRIDEYKGVDLLIQAYESSDKISNKLVIAGRGVNYPYKSDNIIRMNRFIKDEEIAEMFRRAKLVVFPYRSVTMSGILSYPYYFKVPVLTSDVSFFKDNEVEASHFFKTGDVEDLRINLEKLMEQDVIEIDDNAYDRIYSEEALVSSYRKLYASTV